MADVNYSVVDFSGLSAVSDGKTLLYTDGQVCKSEKNLGELIGKETNSKLDTTAFSEVSGNFLTAHQAIPESANWNESNETVTANSGTWNNVSNIKSFTSIAGIEAETSADSIQITNGDNVFITTANKTITISAKDTTYTTEDFIAADHLSYIQTASGYATDWNNNKSNVELASGYAQKWADNSATIIANGNSGVSALNTITANSSTWTKVTALSEGSNVQISNNNENYTIGVSGVVTSASDSLDNKRLVLYNNQWQELNETGAFEVVELKNDKPDVQNPNPKVIYLTKKDDSELKDLYTEWIYSVSNGWEIIGETSVDLSNYYQKSETSGKDQLSTEFDKKLDSSVAQTTYAPIGLTSTVNTLTGSSATWNEVSAKFDSSAMTSYYTKSETSAALDLKEDKVFVAEYNVTPFVDIKAAYDAGKQIVCKYNPLPQFPDQTIFAYLTQYVPMGAFCFAANHTANDFKMIECQLNGWNVRGYEYQEQLDIAGENNTITAINNSAIGGGKTYNNGYLIDIDSNNNINIRNNNCVANTANYAYALGNSNSASGNESLSVGLRNKATQNWAVAIGKDNNAFGTNGVALGDNTSAGNYSLTFGKQNSADEYSIAGGSENSARINSIAFGSKNTVTGDQAGVAIGSANTAYNAFAYGKFNNVNGPSSGFAVAFGIENNVTKDLSFAFGKSNSAGRAQTYMIGESCSADGKNSIAIGYKCYAHGENAFACGNTCTANSNYSFAIGYSTKANGIYAFAEGNVTTAQGQGSHAEGSNTLVQGQYAHSEGGSTTAYGDGSHAEGIGTIISTNGGHAGGLYNKTSSDALFVVGNGNADNSRSDAFIVDRTGQVSAAGNMFTSAGQVVTDVMLTSATNSTTSFVTNGVADLTPLYTYIKSLEDRIAVLEAGTATTPIVNGYNPTVNGDIPII